MNDIVKENQKTEGVVNVWDIIRSGDPSILGFSTEISVNIQETISFKISCGFAQCNLGIYRLGYYNGLGARKISGTNTLNRNLNQPECAYDSLTGLVDCGNWNVSYNWVVPDNAVSGVYFAHLTNLDNGATNQILFIVRNDDSNSDLLFQTSDSTWHAYNSYRGFSLYPKWDPKVVQFCQQAAKVSYNRPLVITQISEESDWFFNAEYPMLRWVERNGYDVTYTTCVDSAFRGGKILQHKVFLSVGHDEYWSKEQRDNVKRARDNGIHLAFFSGNEIYWKTRWEDSLLNEMRIHGTLVCYKEGNKKKEGGEEGEDGNNIRQSKSDPKTEEWTGLWRRGGCYDAGKPENALSGQISFTQSGKSGTAIEVPFDCKDYRFWRNTEIEKLKPDDKPLQLMKGTLDYEWDWEQEEFCKDYPKNRIKLSAITINGKTHHLSIYRHKSGALVFGAGTVQWSWGLDANHIPSQNPAGDIGLPPDRNMQQATVNLFADMGVKPGKLQDDLIPAEKEDWI